jgi:hypothetical protein
MRLDQEDTKAFNTHMKSIRYSHSSKLLSGPVSITKNGAVVSALDANGADRQVFLPPFETGRFYVVNNIGTVGNLVVTDTLANVVTTIEPTQMASLYSNDTNWSVSRSGYSVNGGGYGVFTNVHDGLVPAPHSGAPGSLFLRDDGAWVIVSGAPSADTFKFMFDGTNTATAAGTDTFQFRSSSGSVGIVITNNQATFGDNADFDVIESSVDHNALLNFVANKHIDHSTVTLTAGLALTGGGDITTSRTFDFAPVELTVNAGPVLTDYFIMDLAAGGPRRVLGSVVNGVINHDTLLNWVANKHIDHSGVSIVASTGLSGGGDITTSRSLSLDINSLTTLTPAAVDFIPFHNVAAGGPRKASIATLNGIIDHNALLNYVANQHIDHSAVSVATTEGIQGGGTIAATRTLKLDVNGLTVKTTPAGTDYGVIYDAASSTHKKVLLSTWPGGGGGGGASVTISDTPPGSPSAGNLWWESDTGNLYIYYNDGTSSQWVLASPTVSAAGIGAVAYTPQAPTVAQQTVARQNIYAAPVDALIFNGIQINGSYEVDQPNGGAAVALPAGSGFAYLADSWNCTKTGVNAFTVQLAASVFPGYNNEMKLTVTTAQPTIGSDSISLQHRIEGYRFVKAGWGTAVAQPISAAMWVKSSVAGVLVLQLTDNISVAPAINVTIIAANTPQFVTATFPAQASWGGSKTNGVGGILSIVPMTSGAMNIAATVGNTFEVTGLIILPGVDLPSAARAPLIMRSFDQEIQFCKRYFYNGVPSIKGVVSSPATSAFRLSANHPVQMRATPTLAMTAALPVFDGAATSTCTTIGTNNSTPTVLEVDATIAAGLTAARPVTTYQGAGGNLNVDARL